MVLIIRKPRNIQILKNEYIYTFWEFTSEFGGWVGILFGFCFLDIFNFVTKIFILLVENYNYSFRYKSFV